MTNSDAKIFSAPANASSDAFQAVLDNVEVMIAAAENVLVDAAEGAMARAARNDEGEIGSVAQQMFRVFDDVCAAEGELQILMPLARAMHREQAASEQDETEPTEFWTQVHETLQWQFDAVMVNCKPSAHGSTSALSNVREAETNAGKLRALKNVQRLCGLPKFTYSF